MIKLGGNFVINSMINTNPQKHPLPITLDDDHAMERYIRDKWERKLFKEIPLTPPKEDKNHITDLQQLGGSSTSISTPSISSTISSLPSSPTMQLAGRAATIDTIYSLAPTKNTAHSYNPFVTLPVSSTFSSVPSAVTNNNNNPFLQQQQQQQQQQQIVQSPFDISYNTTSYFNTTPSHQNTNSSHNPFCQ
ncbi:hypothetical protein BD770DRAFT_83887 [Pilaira anomala]|nr:hypothetical protein BD770DRAFT_83887 [Pilaira anomala]